MLDLISPHHVSCRCDDPRIYFVCTVVLWYGYGVGEYDAMVYGGVNMVAASYHKSHGYSFSIEMKSKYFIANGV